MRAWAWWLGLLGAAAGARELDPAACAPRFDVQRDKIIRTEESRDMGARYLSELDVGARHECLRLCCETDSCDVFVYEEKSPGSCYLFNCGPPEDFRCKFTAHSNFSSGVLALSRHLAELQDQERLAHHEQELANLRVRSTSTSSTTASPAPPPPHPHPPPPPPHQPLEHHHQLPTGRCSRYQFECRRGGECIAVYNACDGVPQCADGSDEAPELGCPPPPPPLNPRTTPPPPPPPPPSPLVSKPLPLQVQEPVEALVDGGGGGGVSGGGGVESALALEEAAARDRWPHRLAQALPQHRYNEAQSSHIFSHKGGLVQEPEPAQYAAFEPAAPPAPAPAWPRRAWPHQSGLESVSSERGWGGVGVGMGGGGGAGYPRLEWPETDPRRGWPVPQPRPEPEMPVYIPAKTMPEIPMVYSSQQQTLRDSPKKGFELSKAPPEPEPEPDSEPEPTPAPRQDIDRREETPPHVHNNTNIKLLKDKVEEAKPPGASSEDKKQASSTARQQHAPAADQHQHQHDGLSDHPPAAVLLLVLGILMTTVMGTMLGCRARAARRRLRRGKSPFAHDADYLVNGMYL